MSDWIRDHCKPHWSTSSHDLSLRSVTLLGPDFIGFPLVTSGSIFWEFPHGPSQEKKKAKGKTFNSSSTLTVGVTELSSLWLSGFDYKKTAAQEKGGKLSGVALW